MINKIDWKFDDIVLPEDLNRIEGNIATNESTLNTHISNMLTNPHGVTAEQLGLGNVDNTSDIDKPVSTLQKTAIDEKADTNILTKHIENTVVTTTEGVHGLRYLNTRLQVFENGKWVNVTDDTPAIQVDVTIANFLNTETEIIASKGEKVIKVTTSTNKATINLNEYGLWSFKAVVGEKETQPVELLCDTSKLYNIVLEFVSKKFSFQAPHLSQIAIYNIKSGNNFNFGNYKIFKTVPDTETMEFELTEYGDYKLILIPSGMTYEIIYHIDFSDKGCWYFISPRDDKPPFEQLVEIGDIIKFEYYIVNLDHQNLTPEFATTETPINSKINFMVDLLTPNAIQKYGLSIRIPRLAKLIFPLECIEISIRPVDLNLKMPAYTLKIPSNTINKSVFNVFMEFSQEVEYSIFIDKNNPDPKLSVKYSTTDDSAGMESGWNSWKNKPIFKDIKPCLLKDGKVVGYLQKDDFTKFEDGSPADITTGAMGDVMIEFPKIGWKLEQNADTIHISITNKKQSEMPSYSYFSYLKNDGSYGEKLYLGAYKCCVIGNKVMSLSNKTVPKWFNNMSEARTYASNKNVSNIVYRIMHFHAFSLIQALYLIVFANLNSNNALGTGGIFGYGVPLPQTGNQNLKGMFTSYETPKNEYNKVFGMEDFYGSTSNAVDGIYWKQEQIYVQTNLNVSQEALWEVIPNYKTSSTISVFFVTSINPTWGGAKYGFLMDQANRKDGSVTTYFTDSQHAPLLSNIATPKNVPHYAKFGGDTTLDWRGSRSGMFNFGLVNRMENAVANYFIMTCI